VKITKFLFVSLMLSFLTSTYSQSSTLVEKIEIKTQKRSGIGGYDIGFEKLHELGYTGDGSHIVIIGSGCNSQFSLEHPAFKDQKIDLIDVSRFSECPKYFKNQSTHKYSPDFLKDLDFCTSTDSQPYHEQQITSILVGGSQKDIFNGGIAPLTKITFVLFSQSTFYKNDYHKLQSAGGALEAFENSSNMKPSIYYEEGRTQKKQEKEELLELLNNLNEYSKKDNIDYLKEIVDDSILQAFKVAFKSDARIIQGSVHPQSLFDPKKEFYLSDQFLKDLASSLEKNDQILVLSSGNEGCNITKTIHRAKEEFNLFNQKTTNCNPLEDPLGHFREALYFSPRNYFIQFATHEKLKERILMVTNLDIDENHGTKVTFSNGKEYKVGLYHNSNYPGDNKDLQKVTVSAFGSHIPVATGTSDFTEVNGTSFSVPMVSGLLSLIDECYRKQGKKLSGPDLIKILKETCTLSDPKMTEKFGNGVIDPLGFLKKKQ
jgi:hypothetical protein